MTKVKLEDIALERKEICRKCKDNYPIVGLEDLVPEEVLLASWKRGVDNTFTKIFHKGDILFGRRRAYLKKASVAPFDGICSGDITVIQAIPKHILPELLPFVIQNDAFFDFAVGKSAGSLSPRVKWEHLKNYEFELPSMNKQRKLAELLWAMNLTKETYKELLSATDELVKSQFIELFGTIDDHPENIPYLRLGDVATYVNGYAFKPDDWSSSGIPIIRIQNLTGSNEVVNYYEGDYPEKVEINDGDVLISWSASLGVYLWNRGKAILNQHIFKVVFDKAPIDKGFFVCAVSQKLNEMSRMAHGATMRHIVKKDFDNTVIACPPLNMQREFADFVRQSDKSKFYLEQTLLELNATYKQIIVENLN